MKAGALRLWAIRLLFTAGGKLPLPVIQGTGAVIGWLLWLARTRAALVTRENLALCFPDMPGPAREALARASLVEAGKRMLESGFAWTASIQRCRRAIVHVVGKPAVDAALAEGRGLIFVMPYLGNWEMINHYLGRQYGPTLMYRPCQSRELEHWLQQWRSRTRTRCVKADKHGVKALLVALKTRRHHRHDAGQRATPRQRAIRGFFRRSPPHRYLDSQTRAPYRRGGDYQLLPTTRDRQGFQDRLRTCGQVR